MKPYFETKNGKLYNICCLEMLRQMPENSVDCVIVDPPYGIDYQSARRTDKTEWKPKISNDKEPFIEWIKPLFSKLKDGGRVVCFYRWDVQDAFKNEFERAGYSVKSQIIWDKQIHGMGDLTGEYAPRHENMLYCTKGRYIFKGKRPVTVISVPRVPAEKMVHPNEKPVKLIQIIIKQLTEQGEFVLDCFSGSGVVSMACELESRKWVSMDIDEKHCETAAKRIKKASEQFGLFEGKR